MDQTLFRRILIAVYQLLPSYPFGVSRFSTFDLLVRLTEGRQLPGYRWRSLRARRERRERLKKVAITSATGLMIGLMLYVGAEWYAGLPETSQVKTFLKAVPVISGLLGLLWGLVLVFRGEKRTLWG